MRLSLRLVSRRRKNFFVVSALVVVVFLLYQIFFSVRTSIFIVSLTTTPKRFQFELPLTIRSLLSQTLLPKEIRIYISPVFNRTNLTSVDLRSKISSEKTQNLFDEIVRLKYVENDDGPATKFLPILREFHSDRKRFSQDQPIVICDDDHIYQPNLLSTLDRYSKVYPNEILGFRGWRSETNSNSSFLFFSFKFSFLVRDDLRWGVSDSIEYSFHVVLSHFIRKMYRVGVITANSAYLIRPRFFDEKIYSNFSQIHDEIRHVDDIWLNGHAARRNISRFVVPSLCPSLSVTRTHELENFFEKHQTTRSAANDRALRSFENVWEKTLSYRFHGENHPTYRFWFQTIFRESFCAMWKLQLILQFGKVF